MPTCNSGSSGGGGKVSVGGGYFVKESTVIMRQVLNNKLFERETDRSLAEYGIRRDMQSGKTESEIISETKERLRRFDERSTLQPKEKETREITSSTYKRAMKRTTTDVKRFLGRGLT